MARSAATTFCASSAFRAIASRAVGASVTTATEARPVSGVSLTEPSPTASSIGSAVAR
jgi:hypothetical protein